jgi:capsular polysaccharide biosynthesis protein
MGSSLDRLTESWLVQMTREKLRRDGPVDLLRSIPGFVDEYVVADRPRRLAVLAAVEPSVLDRRELLTRAGRADALWRFGEAERFTVTDDPERDPGAELPYALRRRLGTYTNDRPFVCELRDAALVGTEPVGVTAGREIVLETTDAHRVLLWFRLRSHLEGRSLPQAVREARRLVRERPRPTTAGYDHDVAFLLWKTNVSTFYHWILEGLPKVRALERYREATGRDPAVLLGPDPPSWMRETLSLVGLDPEETVPYEGDVTVDRLVVPSHRNRLLSVPGTPFPDDFHPSPADCRWLRERVASNLPPDATPPAPAGEHDHPPRVYVSRRKADYHRVVNEDALVEALAPLGFEAYALEEYPFATQVALFREAELVVAPHGSGLVNLVFAASEPHVVELFKEKDVRAFYFVLARQLGLPYDYVVGEEVEGNVRVDPAAVRSLVEDALDRRAARVGGDGGDDDDTDADARDADADVDA